MQYYTFVMEEESADLCTIVTPFGKYKYLRLPMGVNQSPDFSQAVMDNMFAALDYVEAYLDDIAIFSNSFTEHLSHVGEVLRRLSDNGFTVKPDKCKWFVKEAEFLGYYLTPSGFKPMAKKVQAILDCAPPTTTSECRSFVGLVTFYRDMYPRRSHILDPLTKLNSKSVKFVWGPEQQKAFETIKSLVAQDVLLRYPDVTKPFDVYTDASDMQLGAVIKQEGKPVAYYSRKLTSTQKRYTTNEKGLLSIVETLREFRTFLLGTTVRVYTDHKNLTFNTLNTDRVLRWRLAIEEFNPTLTHISGKDNIEADALSRLPMVDRPDPVLAETDPQKHLEAFLFHPVLPNADEITFPLDFALLATHQEKDADLADLPFLTTTRDNWLKQTFLNVTLWCYRTRPNGP
jgi:hypothetical protein